MHETMTESKVYTSKAPFDILESILKRLDPQHCLYGSFLYRLIDPSQTLETIPRQLSVQMSRFKFDKFVHLLDDTGFLRSSLTRSNTLLGDSYTQAQLELEINGAPFSLEILALNGSGSQKLKPWTDFTCNNLAFIGKNVGTVIALRVSDPQEKMSDEQFLGRCFRDIYAHKLVPMCPDSHLRMTEKTHPHIRRQYVKMVRHAMHHMTQGWTLEPSLTGKALEFTQYKPTSSLEVCVICQEKMTELAVTLVCGHSFHIDCLYRQMMEDGPPAYKCSLCNKHILFSGKPDVKPSPPRVHVSVPTPVSGSTALGPETSGNSGPPGSQGTTDTPTDSSAAAPAAASFSAAPASATSSTPSAQPSNHPTRRRAVERGGSPRRRVSPTRRSLDEDEQEWVEITGGEIQTRGRHVISNPRIQRIREMREIQEDDDDINEILTTRTRPIRCVHRSIEVSSISSCSSDDSSDCSSDDSSE